MEHLTLREFLAKHSRAWERHESDPGPLVNALLDRFFQLVRFNTMPEFLQWGLQPLDIDLTIQNQALPLDSALLRDLHVYANDLQSLPFKLYELVRANYPIRRNSEWGQSKLATIIDINYQSCEPCPIRHVYYEPDSPTSYLVQFRDNTEKWVLSHDMQKAVSDFRFKGGSNMSALAGKKLNTPLTFTFLV